MYRKSYCIVPGVGVVRGSGVGGGVSKMFKFYVKVFYVMVKALSCKLWCTRQVLFMIDSLR